MSAQANGRNQRKSGQRRKGADFIAERHRQAVRVLRARPTRISRRTIECQFSANGYAYCRTADKGNCQYT